MLPLVSYLNRFQKMLQDAYENRGVKRKFFKKNSA